MLKRVSVTCLLAMACFGQSALASEPQLPPEKTFFWYGEGIYIGSKTLDQVADELLDELIAEGDLAETVLVAQR